MFGYENTRPKAHRISIDVNYSFDYIFVVLKEAKLQVSLINNGQKKQQPAQY